MKKILFVVDEKMLGGVSIVLENILWSLDLEKYKVDVAVLHNRGECLVNIPKNINVIAGGPFFDSVDFPLSEIIKSKNIKLLFNKLRLVLYLKSGLIRKKIMKERKK